MDFLRMLWRHLVGMGHRWSNLGLLTINSGGEESWEPYDEPRRLCTVCRRVQVKVDGKWRWTKSPV